MDVPTDIRLIGVSPHMHYLGREVKAVATLPNGEEISLLSIPDWNFRWQKCLHVPRAVGIACWNPNQRLVQVRQFIGEPREPPYPARPRALGLVSDEEMSELWMRFTTDNPRISRGCAGPAIVPGTACLGNPATALVAIERSALSRRRPRSKMLRLRSRLRPFVASAKP